MSESISLTRIRKIQKVTCYHFGIILIHIFSIAGPIVAGVVVPVLVVGAIIAIIYYRRYRLVARNDESIPFNNQAYEGNKAIDE